MSCLANNKKWSTQNEIYHEIQKYDSYSVIYFINTKIRQTSKMQYANELFVRIWAQFAMFCSIRQEVKTKKLGTNRWLIILRTFVWCAWTNIEVFAFFCCLFVFLRRIFRIMIVICFSLDVLSWLRSSVSQFRSGFSQKPNNSIKLWWW